ncbi:BLUF domain-containing protein [Aquimarina agarivorans]|uniref:BLUF domain-containing protein n=1 Tax=Aquimarina agarivorans TaxID=980584 RepID=UPI000248F875|nr:BLUF domain-containing protein [Aquimarina agarivorans]
MNSTYCCAIYISKATLPMTDVVIKNILKKSRANNLERKISGYLYYDDGHFLQYIETDIAQTLDKLIVVLEKDQRHQIINCFKSCFTGNKRFLEWSMGQIDKNQLINLNLEQQIMNYMKWLKSQNHNVDMNSSKIWNMVDLLASHKKVLQLI